MTALAEKITKVRGDATEMRLYNIAGKYLRRNKCNPTQSIYGFLKEITEPAVLLIALEKEVVDYEDRRKLALEFLTIVAKDMEGLKISGVRTRVESHTMPGAAKDGEGVQPSNKSQTKNGPSPSPDAGVQSRAESPPISGTVVPKPTRVTAEAMRTVNRITTSVFDSHKVLDGRAIGDLRMDELERLEARNRQEYALLRMIRKHIVPSDPNAKVRDVISENEMQRMIQKSAELADNMG